MNQIKDFFGEFMEIQKQFLENDKDRAIYFNPFRLFNLINDENTQGNILAWFFDPLASHSQGDLFFKAFLDHFNLDVAYDSTEYKVIREYTGLESIVDILIYGKRFIIFFEMKTRSPEGEDQTNREYRDLLRLAKSLSIENKYYAIFLSPFGYAPQNNSFKSISYQQLSRAFKNNIGAIRSEYVRYFVSSWIDITTEIGRQ